MIRCDHLIREKQMVKCTKSEVRRLKTALLRWKDIPPIQRERIQMVLMRESGMTQPNIAEVMGKSLSTVNRAHKLYDEGGVKGLKPKPIGGRKRQLFRAGLRCWPGALHSWSKFNENYQLAVIQRSARCRFSSVTTMSIKRSRC